jgi:hypothetical protein
MLLQRLGVFGIFAILVYTPYQKIDLTVKDLEVVRPHMNYPVHLIIHHLGCPLVFHLRHV